MFYNCFLFTYSTVTGRKCEKNIIVKTFGLHDKDGKFYIGNSKVAISGDNIIIDDETFKGTYGLWELITSKTPDPEITGWTVVQALC